MGSLLLFAALAAVMLVTRGIDWYRLAPELGSGRRGDPAGAGKPGN